MIITGFLDPMAVKVRTVNLRGLENISSVQLCIVIVIALLCVGLMIFLDRIKPEWKGVKSKSVAVGLAVIMIGITIFVF